MAVSEITIELTDFCEHDCKFCSSNTVNDPKIAKFIDFNEVCNLLQSIGRAKLIHLSGGEPIAHPRFYDILSICKKYSDDVIVHTNALTHIAYNLHVIDSIYIEPYITVQGVDKIHVVKRIKQGREATRPEVSLSRNFKGECKKECDHFIVKPNFTIVKSPCKKFTPVDLTDKRIHNILVNLDNSKDNINRDE